MMLLKQYMVEIEQACREFRVKELHVFGSVIKGDFHSGSDIDFLVTFDRKGYAGSFNQYMGFKEKLEAILNRKVDLISPKNLKNPIFRDEIESTKELIYVA